MTLDPRTGPMLASFLDALGFKAMAVDCAATADVGRLRQYARIVLKQTKNDFTGKVQMKSNFTRLGLL